MTIDRFKLHGTYRTPQFRYGATVECEVRGEMIITGISDAPIPWPVGRKPNDGGPAYLIVYRGLARAVRRESRNAVAHHWGLSAQTVTVWRRALGVEQNNEGTLKLRSAHYRAGGGEKAIAGLVQAIRDPERDAARREKISAAKKGKQRPRHVIDAMSKARRGKPLQASTRAKMSESHRKRGTRPPWLNPAWTAEEDAYLLAGGLTVAELSERTGRTPNAVILRRKKLGLPDLRRRTR